MAYSTDTDIPTDPFKPVLTLTLTTAESELHSLLQETHSLIQDEPALVAAVARDLDAYALRKKAVRDADAKWLAERNPSLPGIPEPQVDPGAPQALHPGRPRTPAYVVLIGLFLRGYCGSGFKSADVTSLMTESVTLQVFFHNLGMKMPGRSTLTELVNAVSNETRLLMLDAQVARVVRLELDDFSSFLQDSTHVAGNTAWPTESRLMVKLVERLLRISKNLGLVHLPPLHYGGLEKHLDKLRELNRKIEFSYGKKGGKRNRRRRYEQMLRKARRIDEKMTPEVEKLAQQAQALDILPSKKAISERVVEHLRGDLEALRNVCDACEARVLQDKQVPMNEKVLSTSDPDAGFISKGQRQPVIGYKPQLARSDSGFITALHLPRGNASDSKNLIPLLDEAIGRTGVTPRRVIVDDGYASAANVSSLKRRAIGLICIHGAKGRALTPPEEWESEPHKEARSDRSAVESMMYTIKQGFEFGEVARRGLDAVYGELLEKALAYNACFTVRRRREAEASAKPPGEPPGQTAA